MWNKLCPSDIIENNSQEIILENSNEIVYMSNVLEIDVGIEDVIGSLENQTTSLTNEDLENIQMQNTETCSDDEIICNETISFTYLKPFSIWKLQ